MSESKDPFHLSACLWLKGMVSLDPRILVHLIVSNTIPNLTFALAFPYN
jgi:hypothetical protein